MKKEFYWIVWAESNHVLALGAALADETLGRVTLQSVSRLSPAPLTTLLDL